jgi:hypothetical protein
MSDPLVDSIFGENAGIIWRFLNSNGPSNIEGILKATKLSRELVFGALGWLGREDKVILEKKGRAMVFSLKEYEFQSEPNEVATVEEIVPRKQSMRRKLNAPKRTKKVRESKPPVAQIESSSKQSDRMEEYLLH